MRICADGERTVEAHFRIRCAPPPPDPETELVEGDRETRTALFVCLDAINFGSADLAAVTGQDPGLPLIEHGSPEEVELRACAVQAVELLSASTLLSPAEIDGILWNRGREQRYKSVPRPRSRNTAY